MNHYKNFKKLWLFFSDYLEWAAATNLKDESKKVPDSCCKTADSDCQSHQTSENIYIDGKQFWHF